MQSLVKSPEQRLTIPEMLEHPWIRSRCAHLEARQQAHATAPVTASHKVPGKTSAVSFDKHKSGHVADLNQAMTRLAV